MNIKPIAAILAAAFSTSAFADEHCTAEPRARWIATADMQARVEKQGLTVQRMETDDGCYEVHATRKNGDRIEMKLHPVTGAVVEEDIKYARPAAPTAAGPVAPALR